MRDQLSSRVVRALTDRQTNSESIRSAARSHAIRLTLNLSEFWNNSGEAARQNAIDVIDMFSGCGGMSAGFRAVNAVVPVYRHILAVDIDEVANATYEANLGLRPSPVSVSDLARRPKLLDRVLADSARNDKNPLVLIGCAPCQGFSSHRNRLGESDERNSLFVDFAEVAVRLKPAAVIVENVPELLTNKYWRFVEKARHRLENAGYFVHLSVCNMAEFGVPQERFRAVMLALRKPFVPISGFVNRESFRTVRETIGTLPRIRAGVRCPTDPLHRTAGHHESTLATIRAVPRNGGSRPDGVGPACLVRVKERQGRSAYDDVYGRLYWDRPAITITASSRNPASGRFIHPEQNRGLSIREAALLQSFPKNYEFKGSLDEAFKQIGNAVPPAFATYLGMHLLGEMFDPATVEKMELGVGKPLGTSFSRLIPALKAGHTDVAIGA